MIAGDSTGGGGIKACMRGRGIRDPGLWGWPIISSIMAVWLVFLMIVSGHPTRDYYRKRFPSLSDLRGWVRLRSGKRLRSAIFAIPGEYLLSVLPAA